MVGTKQTQRKGTGASEGADASKDAPRPPQEVEVVELLDSSSDDDSSDECVIVDPPPKPAAKRRRTEGAGAGAGAGAAQQGTPTRKRGTRLGGYFAWRSAYARRVRASLTHAAGHPRAHVTRMVGGGRTRARRSRRQHGWLTPARWPLFPAPNNFTCTTPLPFWCPGRASSSSSSAAGSRRGGRTTGADGCKGGGGGGCKRRKQSPARPARGEAGACGREGAHGGGD